MTITPLDTLLTNLGHLIVGLLLLALDLTLGCRFDEAPNLQPISQSPVFGFSGRALGDWSVCLGSGEWWWLRVVFRWCLAVAIWVGLGLRRRRRRVWRWDVQISHGEVVPTSCCWFSQRKGSIEKVSLRTRNFNFCQSKSMWNRY